MNATRHSNVVLKRIEQKKSKCLIPTEQKFNRKLDIISEWSPWVGV